MRGSMSERVSTAIERCGYMHVHTLEVIRKLASAQQPVPCDVRAYSSVCTWTRARTRRSGVRHSERTPSVRSDVQWWSTTSVSSCRLVYCLGTPRQSSQVGPDWDETAMGGATLGKPGVHSRTKSVPIVASVTLAHMSTRGRACAFVVAIHRCGERQ